MFEKLDDPLKDLYLEVNATERYSYIAGSTASRARIDVDISQDPSDIEYVVTYQYRGDDYVLVETKSGTRFLYGYWRFRKGGIGGQWPHAMKGGVIREHDVVYNSNDKHSACEILYPANLDYIVCDFVFSVWFNGCWHSFPDAKYSKSEDVVYFSEFHEYIEEELETSRPSELVSRDIVRERLERVLECYKKEFDDILDEIPVEDEQTIRLVRTLLLYCWDKYVEDADETV